MKFKHTFHVFVDNFSIIYKHLLYNLIIFAISGVICALGVYPFIRDLINSEELTGIINGFWNFIINLSNGKVSELETLSNQIQEAYVKFLELLQSKTLQIVLSGLLLLLIIVIAKWFRGLGNYAMASVINDKMALRAEKPFFGTLISSLKVSTLYSLIYVPLSIVYDLLIGVGMFFLLFTLLSKVLSIFICMFLFMLIILLSVVLKMTFTSDWLPALIRGKKGQLGAFRYTFNPKGKGVLSVASNFAVIILIIMSLNVTALLTTFGVGLLLTIPSSYAILICFELVNYYDREEIKYFVDKNTIIAPAKEKPLSREDFFKGEQ